jgi:DNA-binding response OmpR family regulator
MRILLAEDERDLSRALSAILSKNNYSVDAVYNGEDAISYIESGVYDCVILDVMMPKIDGITVLKNIRSKNINIPIIILTAKTEIEDRITGLDCGADDYMTKPFYAKELLARIRAITRRSNYSGTSTITFGNTTLDRTTYTLSTESNSLRLANKEYQMLELLLFKPGTVIPVDKFMDKIWGYDSESDINVVWVYVSYLRKKLSQLDSNLEIKAMRNSGYYLSIKND